jgi:prepilin-type N-terminal cleavage/methylation domain-containing protein
MAQKRNGKKGFTLIEVIVVLVILAILAAIAIPALTGYIDKANQRAAISQAAVVRTALQAIASDSYTTKPGSNNGITTTLTGEGLLKLGSSAGTLAIEGYSPIAPGDATNGVTIGDEVRALTGTDIPADDSDLTNITFNVRTVKTFTVKINDYTVIFDGDYTIN